MSRNELFLVLIGLSLLSAGEIYAQSTVSQRAVAVSGRVVYTPAMAQQSQMTQAPAAYKQVYMVPLSGANAKTIANQLAALGTGAGRDELIRRYPVVKTSYATATGTYTFSDLAPGTGYYMVVAGNSAVSQFTTPQTTGKLYTLPELTIKGSTVRR